MNATLAYVAAHGSELLQRTVEHLVLTGVSSLAAVAAGVPLGILVHRCPRVRGPVLGVTGMIQTIPSVALLALLMIPMGLGLAPAITALILYALLPIVLNTYTGLSELSPSVLEAADGLGFTRRQRLWRVELPLAAPVILAGVRTAAVITVGIATLSALIGAGGLGVFIFRGLSTGNARSILVGVVSAAVMAMGLGYGIGTAAAAVKRASHQT